MQRRASGAEGAPAMRDGVHACAMLTLRFARQALPIGRAARHHMSHAAGVAVGPDASTIGRTAQSGEFVAREIIGDQIDLSIGQPSPSSLPLGALAAAAAHRLGATDAASSLLLQYGPRQGYRSFRTSLASFLAGRYGAAVDPEHLMVTAGARVRGGGAGRTR
ncbi:hypothetical protein TSOC_013134 [Tetrabaena socialis]|uniref:Aminotransferase class I/classII large domain-containing protein n=1 Tax=Tetrabaena socialis TaxID=47790 RepID=A0A2J7ZL57_9CHLO|nr:hypothetical protein TSOC_013134 [Tetrabaena socialis]|eukprot:PNH01005.1 hypothetical protein TSOC_013134 [Tetrabaena socialis]